MCGNPDSICMHQMLPDASTLRHFGWDLWWHERAHSVCTCLSMPSSLYSCLASKSNTDCCLHHRLHAKLVREDAARHLREKHHILHARARRSLTERPAYQAPDKSCQICDFVTCALVFHTSLEPQTASMLCCAIFSSSYLLPCSVFIHYTSSSMTGL